MSSSEHTTGHLGDLPARGNSAWPSRRRRAALVAALAAGGLGAAAGSAQAAINVINTNDAGGGSLRTAIDQANGQAGTDRIAFAIPGAGPHTITLLSDLPAITEPVRIDGYSQTGAHPATPAGGPADLRVVVDATLATVGLELLTDDSLIRGLVISDATGPGADGIRVQGARNRVTGNYVGTDVDGLAQPGISNDGDGVEVTGDDNVIGGPTLDARNIIADNGDAGVRVAGNGSTGNSILGNYIGTDVTGAAAAGNSDGVVVEGDRNVVGGTQPGMRNVIADNFDGVKLDGNDNLVLGNAIGTDLTTTDDLGNFNGVKMAGDGNVVGTGKPGAGNVISANDNGVVVTSGSSNRIAGNVIGPDETGLTLPSGLNGQDGIRIDSSDNVIGGAADGEGNLISGNDLGIELAGDSNDVLGNRVGTTVDGDSALENDDGGIDVSGDFNEIGGPADGEGNVVSGNGSVAIEMSGSDPQPAVGNRIRGNLVGVDAAGTAALPNEGYGVLIEDAANTRLGGPGTGEGNVISGNERDGVHLQIGWGTVEGNLIRGNQIGTDARGELELGNGGSGVGIDDGVRNQVGAVERGRANTIAHNAENGVTVHSGDSNAVLANAIFENGDLGIDLDDDGTTANDPSPDADTGANGLQNHPTVQSASVLTDPLDKSATTAVGWTLASAPSTRYRIEFFASPSCDDPASGQARTFLGAIEATTSPAGLTGPGTRGGGTKLTTKRFGGHQITMTATPLEPLFGTPLGTSELSACTAATPAPGP